VFVVVGAQDARAFLARSGAADARGGVPTIAAVLSYFQSSWHRRPGNAVSFCVINLVIDLMNGEERRARRGDTIDDD
jgi:hypothetical protein